MPKPANKKSAIKRKEPKESVFTDLTERTWLAEIRAKSKQRGTDKMSMPQINSIVSEARRSSKPSTKKLFIGKLDPNTELPRPPTELDGIHGFAFLLAATLTESQPV